MSNTAQLRYNKLQELHTFYQTHQTVTQSMIYISMGSLIIAWIVSFFTGFTLPFFFYIPLVLHCGFINIYLQIIN